MPTTTEQADMPVEKAIDTSVDNSLEEIPSGRFTPRNVSAELGLLADLAGTWEGFGFNLIARPAFHFGTDLYLQLNSTRETLKFDPIGSVIPNRGFGQKDIGLHGLTYLQKISDAGKDGALHIEPGIWIRQPNTTFPAEKAAPEGQELVGRMGSIPHGNALLAEGIAKRFSGPPTLPSGGVNYHGSIFPSFNSTPFGVPPTAPAIAVNAATSSEALTAPNLVPPAVPFPEYNLANPPGPANTRTPYATSPPEPPIPNTPENQAMVDDPIVLLQNVVSQQVREGYTFEGVALNIATQRRISFLTTPNQPTGATVPVDVPQFGGGIENIHFLDGKSVIVAGKPEQEENAKTALVYATFWIEKLTHKKTGHSFMQLQYAQMVVLNFPIRHLLHPTPPVPPVFVNLGWPHISVATLKKNFG
jgi:hypothetical protein